MQQNIWLHMTERMLHICYYMEISEFSEVSSEAKDVSYLQQF